MSNRNEILYAVYKKGHGSWDETYDMLKKKVAVTDEEIMSAKDDLIRLETSGVNMTMVISDNYPYRFINSHSRPPFVFFYNGRLDLLSKARGLGLVSLSKSKSGLSYRLLDKVVSDLNDFDYKDKVDRVVLVYDKSKKDIVLKASKGSKVVLFFLKGLDVLDEEEKGIADIIVTRGGLVASIVLPGVNKATKMNEIDTYSCLVALVSSVYFAEYYSRERGDKERIDSAILNIALSNGRDILVSPRGVYFDEVSESLHDDSNELIKDGATIIFNKATLEEALSF